MDGSHLIVLGAGDGVQVFGPDSFVPGQLGAGSSDHAEGASVFLTLDLCRRDCLWVLILGISSNPLKGLRSGGVGSGWVDHSGLRWCRILETPVDSPSPLSPA